MSRAASAGAWLLLALVAGCSAVTAADGVYVCAASGAPCPSNYSCIDGTCWRNGHTPLVDGATDGAPSDAALDAAVPDAALDAASTDAAQRVVSVANSTLSATPASVLANGVSVGTLGVQLRDGNNSPIEGVTVTFSSSNANDVITQPAGATNANGITSGTIASTIAENKTITAHCGGVNLTGGITFGAPVPFTIAFTTAQIPNAGPNQALSPPVTVLVEDASLTPLPNASVMVSLTNNTSSATLSGMTTALTSGNGVATFSTLQIDQPQNGYKLTASAGGISTTSAAFNIVAGLPDAPGGVTATATASTITLMWSAVSGATGYNVLRSTSAGAEVLLAAGTNVQGTMFTDANLLRGTYYYTVQTRNAVGTGVSSLEVNAFASRELCVANYNTNSVSVINAAANTTVTPLRSLGTSVSTPFAVAADTVHDQIFVANFIAGTVTVYPRTGTSTTAATNTLSSLGRPAALLIDTTNDELWVANSSANSVAAYDRSALTVKRTIVGAATLLNQPEGLGFDLTDGEIIVANAGNDTVLAFARTGTGNVAPLRTPLHGANTQLNSSQGVVYDAAHDQIIVANAGNNAVTAYPRTATGNAYPTWWLAGGSTSLSGPVGLALDPLAGSAEEILVVNDSGGATDSITTYSAVHTCSTTPCTTPTDDSPSRVINSSSLNGSQGAALCN